ncbi:relaxase/mobilization nuclease domain-containing protein [Flavobacterium sp. TR2]|uniref:relaxase/mobilization nuclease domain-containing protein n=1 Tax=Flavobacterium sp. TR2 TaxID=2977321 RepID=UPI0021B0FB2E|nr:relaxase/mobilization nuclease domain-containing protein [Flavobacterium sp. TR2]UWY29365.1 relaxase/mobilization nuclease domain-containing protein [Flavobacterium sp. TR2]
MIATATTGTGFKGCLSYVQKEHEKNLSEEEKPELISKNNIYGDTQKMSSQMHFLANENSRVSRPVLHVAVSFHKDEKLSPENAQKAVNAVLKEVGVDKENNQYLLMKHNDAKHEHYHAVINKVGLDGKNLNTSYIVNRLQVACDKVEKEQGLRRTEGRTVVYDPTNEKGYRFLNKEEKAVVAEKKRETLSRDKDRKISDEKNHIKAKVSEALKDHGINTPEKLKNALGKEAIETKFMQNKNGICGISFRYNNQSHKGSALGYKWNNINNKLYSNQKLTSMKLTPEEKKEIQFKDDYNKAIRTVINEHGSAFRNGNLNPDTDKIFMQNGFKKEEEKFVFERENQKITVSEKPFDFAKEEVSKQYEAFKEREREYNQLMSTAPQKKPLFFGKKEVEKANSELLGKQLLTGKPEFRPGNYGLNGIDFHVNSTTIQQKAREEQMSQHRLKLDGIEGERRNKIGRGIGR